MKKMKSKGWARVLLITLKNLKQFQAFAEQIPKNNLLYGLYDIVVEVAIANVPRSIKYTMLNY